MLKIFFIIFFIAELVIAFALIFRICKIDKYVNKYNSIVVKNKSRIKFFLEDINLLIENFNNDFFKIKNLISEKRQEYILQFLKTALIYLSILTLKGKYKKTVIAYQLIKEVYEGIKEA